MSFTVSTFLDFAILALLAGTVFYALRLSEQLKLLKDSKNELEQLVSSLSINIGRAHEAIEEMQVVAKTSNETLQNAMRDAQDLSQELQIMTDSGDRVANRLEQAVPSKTHSSAQDQKDHRRKTSPRPPVQSVEHFFIRDRDFEQEEDRDEDDYDHEADEYDYGDAFENLSSRAEKQLASALRRTRKFDA